jgi:glucosyl-3-phosphoglycerate synthase
VQERVRRWFDGATSRAADWPVPALQAAKAALGGNGSVSVVLPALDEEATVGGVVACVVALADSTGLVDEVVVVDSGSTDRTAAVAAAAGAKVVAGREIMPTLGTRPGKGEALWKSLAATTGEVVVFVDTDLLSPRPEYVTGLLGPLFADPGVQLVKGCYDRPLAGDGPDAGPVSGGRVTELVARPLLNLLVPDLAGIIQPLSGEYAARRGLLETLPFSTGYGVETGLLVDTYTAHGLPGLAQVDLGERAHVHQDTAALGRMAAEVVQTLMRRLERPTATTLTQFRRAAAGYEPVTADVAAAERPPIVTVPAYHQSVPGRRSAASGAIPATVHAR